VKKRPVQTWIDPDFHKKLKVESSLQGMSMLQYTKFLANKGEDLISEKSDAETKKRFKFNL
jgi:hypothetical protein